MEMESLELYLLVREVSSQISPLASRIQKLFDVISETDFLRGVLRHIFIVYLAFKMMDVK